jgi:hypothetical protein
MTNYQMATTTIGSEHFDYDSFGAPIRCVEFDVSGRETFSSDFVYESQESRGVIKCIPSGKLIKRIVEVYEGILLPSLPTYDEDDRLIRERTFQYAGNKLTKSDSRYYLPDGTLCEQRISG